MDDIKQKEYSNLISISEKLESRVFQLILFTLTAFGVIFGFRNKIDPDYFFPIMLYVVLFFTTTAGAHAKINQARITAYLNKEYFLKDPSIYYSKFYLNTVISKKGFWDKVLIFIKNPFIDFNVLPLILICIEINNNICASHHIWFYIALAFMLVLQIFIILRVLDMMKKDINYFFIELEKFKNNNSA